ncbi:MAG: glycosyltransferase [Prevotellaceae bacterium]|nr:glycosyltransferase [Prevotellaceae bacterium]
MKILFYADTVFGFGGVQRVLAVIAKALAKDNDVTILSTDTDENLSMYGYNQSDIHFDYILYNGKKNIEYFTCKAISCLYKKVLPKNRFTARLYSYSFFRPSYKRQLISKINRGHYDTVVGVHAFLSLHLAAVRNRLNSKNITAWMHNSYNALFDKENPYLPGLKSFFANEMRGLEGIVVLSKSDERLFRDNLGLESVTIYNPLTLTPRGRASVEYKKFLAVGRFSPKHKGFDLLIKAFAKFSQTNNDWMLEIVGEGEEENMYRQLIAEHQLEQRVKICPFTNDIQRHYAGASVYVLSSRWEGQPLVLVEAMAHGLPIVSSDLPVAKELLEGRGCGIFFKCGDINDMALALSRMSSTTEWADMSEKALKTSSLFKVENILQQWVKVLQRCSDGGVHRNFYIKNIKIFK